jgi:hypothetical protein
MLYTYTGLEFYVNVLLPKYVNVNVAATECLSEFGQQDSEYTEDYAMVTQHQISSLTEQTEPTSAPVPKPRYVLQVPTR